MLLRERIAKLGAVFFKYRSWTPAIFAVVLFAFLAEKNFHYHNRFDDSTFYEIACFAVSLSGLAVRVFTVAYSREGTSGRFRSAQRAESLNTDGAYSVVRNPLYIGNFLIVMGITFLFPHHTVIAFNMLLFILFYVPIVFQEEDFLLGKFKEEYREYCLRTPAVIPSFRLWKKPQLKFNLTRVLYRENGTFMGVVLGFVAIETLNDYFVAKRFHVDWPWAVLLMASLAMWIVSRFLKRRLKLLDTAP
jgi:protein-S-isoprenylcysteine O-methyltransferase Ste14